MLACAIFLYTFAITYLRNDMKYGKEESIPSLMGIGV
jgi:hypothetical protein